MKYGGPGSRLDQSQLRFNKTLDQLAQHLKEERNMTEMMTTEGLRVCFRNRFFTFIASCSVIEGVPQTLCPNEIAVIVQEKLDTHYQRCLAQGENDLFRKKSTRFWLELAALVVQNSKWTETRMREAADLFTQKRIDYGHQNITSFGQVGICVRATDKTHRISNIVARDGYSAVGEGLEDALSDIVGYSAVAFLYLNDQMSDESVRQVMRNMVTGVTGGSNGE